MSMFTLTGKVVHFFDAPGYRDRETGGLSEDTPKVQILGVVPQRNGHQKLQMVDLTCRDPSSFKPFLGMTVTVPIGFYAAAKDKAVFFIPEGCKPVLGPSEGFSHD